MGNHPRRAMVKDWPAYLRTFRAKHDLTQAGLADGLMVSRRLVENWESGLNSPPAYLKIALQSLGQKLCARE